MKNLFSVLKVQDHQVDVLKAHISIFLHCLFQMEMLVGQDEVKEIEISTAHEWFEVSFQEWVKSKYGTFFGKRVEQRTTLSHGTMELKV